MVEKENAEKTTEVVDDKEVKATEETKQGSGTSSNGEYREAAMGYLKQVSGREEIPEGEYVAEMEKTLSTELLPKVEAYEAANTTFKSMLHGNKNLGKVLTDMAKGATFEESFPRYYDVSKFQLQEGDPDYLKWEAASKQREAEYKESLDKETQLKNNQEKSAATISSWFEEKAFGDDEKKEYGMFVTELLDRAYAGEVTPEFLNKMYYAMKYEDDVNSAAEAGEVKGRNAKIVEEELAEEELGDGLPDLDTKTVADVKDKEEAPEANPLVKGLRNISNHKSVIPGNY